MLRKNLQIILNLSKRSFSKNLSYIHRIENDSFKFLTIGQLLKISAEKYSEREAAVSCAEKSRVYFREVLEKADRLAGGLLNLGLKKGDCVGIWSPNYEFWYISMMAIARAGLVCVALNPAYTASELSYCIDKVNIKAIIAPEAFRKQKHYEMLKSLSNNSLKNLIIHSDRKLDALQYNDLIKSSSESDRRDIEELQSSISPDAGCNIQFTSGTTGKPKAALLSHFSMINNGYHVGKRQEFDTRYSRVCVNNPLFHVYGCIIAILNSLFYGATMIFPAPHFSPEDSLKAIVRENCNVLYGTPTMFVDLIAKQREMKIKLPEIELANTGGSVCSPQLVKDIMSELKVKKMQSVYGLTETSAVVFQSLPNDKSELVEEYVGTIGDNIEAKVIDKDGNVVPFGVAGELCIRGYCNMLGYFGDEEKTKEVLGADNWFKTGDQFIIYENGYGKVSGRLKEMIIRGGENLFPREIEDFLNTHENIIECHVIGIPDERMGEEVGAFIRLKDKLKPLSKEDIKKFCDGKISHFKIPKYVVTVDEFPRTLSGKIQKFKFIEIFCNKIKNK